MILETDSGEVHGRGDDTGGNMEGGGRPYSVASKAVRSEECLVRCSGSIARATSAHLHY